MWSAPFTSNSAHLLLTKVVFRARLSASLRGALSSLFVRRGVGQDVVIEEVIDPTSVDAPVEIDMPFQNSVNAGEDFAAYYARVLTSPVPRALTLRFLASSSARLMAAALNGEPGSVITVTEEVLGLDEALYAINGVRFELIQTERGPGLFCEWEVETVDAERYWLVGTAGASEIGVTTVAGW